MFDELGVQPNGPEAGLDASTAKALADALGPRFEPFLQAGRRLTGGEVSSWLGAAWLLRAFFICEARGGISDAPGGA